MICWINIAKKREKKGAILKANILFVHSMIFTNCRVDKSVQNKRVYNEMYEIIGCDISITDLPTNSLLCIANVRHTHTLNKPTNDNARGHVDKR